MLLRSLVVCGAVICVSTMAFGFNLSYIDVENQVAVYGADLSSPCTHTDILNDEPCKNGVGGNCAGGHYNLATCAVVNDKDVSLTRVACDTNGCLKVKDSAEEGNCIVQIAGPCP